MATDDKYDRQIRLWGPHGQKALMEAQVCVLGSSPCATEALKNLVLPGIGHFTVVDNAVVELADLGNNFFLEEGDVGLPRAEAVSRLLQEMNPDVRGSHVVKDAATVISEGVEFFRPFALVIACQLTQGLAAKLCTICQELGVPLVLITSLGFVGKIRLYVSEHCVCETKPDNELGDLRINDPFPELRRFADSIDIDKLDDAEHAHVPYVVILIRALDVFRSENDGKNLPSTREEKDRFKAIIARMQRNQQEANFSEALDNAYKAWVPYSIPEAMEQVLTLKTTNSKSDFWVVARAVSQFVRDCGKLPLAGTVPDMTASTDSYVRLQEIYNSRAEGDCAAINAHIATIHKELEITRAIPAEFVKRFCQNAQYCEVFTFHTIEEECRPCSMEDGGLDLACECMDEESQVKWYLALRAADQFRENHGHWPGQLCSDKEEDLASDVAGLMMAANKIVESYKAEGASADKDALEEVVRYGGAELHVTSSVLGGIAAQEAVKMVTKQYAPLNNTLIYNGVNGCMQTIEC